MERLLLQKTLSDILGCPDRGEKCRVYFQPPASKEMIYDCIVYERSRIEPTFADNQPYALHDRAVLVRNFLLISSTMAERIGSTIRVR